ncbi:MAG: ATP-binding protein [Defluviitaleaceae bacterium]|nr:ATP-binding protein [Defluviitaleaceae bacterium]
MDLITSRYEVASLITDTTQLHIVYLGTRHIHFTVNADAEMPAHLVGDELRIKQVLNNILSNAFKYTDDGSVTLNISCEYVDGNKTHNAPVNLLLQVTDTGKGMTPQQQAAITEEYARFHTREGKFIQGTGLGMSIVSNLINLMSGSMHIESAVGKGTTVTLRIPQKISGTYLLGNETAENLRNYDCVGLQSPRKLAFKPEPMPYGSVLIVDDVDTNLYVARGLMGFYSLQIDTLDSGQAAIDRVKQGATYDIIFMDYMMPGLNGIETTKQIRQLGYKLPIVALTANALIGQADEFLNNGFDGFVSKPIQSVHLNAVLNKFIRDKQTPEVLAAARASVVCEDNSATAAAPNLDTFLQSHDIHIKLCQDFLRGQSNAIPQIHAALNINDYETAHRLAHTLKGMAGLINETRLAEYAAKAEADFRAKKPSSWLHTLATELEGTLAYLSAKLAATPKPVATTTIPLEALDRAATTQLLDDLETLLATADGKALDHTETLATIPHTQDLIAHIENFDFDLAQTALASLRETLEL